MQKTWLKKEGQTKLLVVALGWGASPEVIQSQHFSDYDVVCLYDYHSLDVELSDIEQYNDISLMGWSFGVWAAERVLYNIKFTQAIAICGSPYPINKDFGIDPRAFAITLRGIVNEGVGVFLARMCGKKLREYMQNHSTRNLEDIREELQVLAIKSIEPYTPKIKWTKAILSGKDRIFPTQSAANYWTQTGVPYNIIEDMPHYPFAEENFICNTIKN